MLVSYSSCNYFYFVWTSTFRKEQRTLVLSMINNVLQFLLTRVRNKLGCCANWPPDSNKSLQATILCVAEKVKHLDLFLISETVPRSDRSLLALEVSPQMKTRVDALNEILGTWTSS